MTKQFICIKLFALLRNELLIYVAKHDAGAGRFAICLLRRPRSVLGHPYQASPAREEAQLHQHYVRQCLLLRGYTRIVHDSKLLQSRRVKLDRRNSPQGTVDRHLWKMVSTVSSEQEIEI